MGDVLFIVYSAISLVLLAMSCGPHFRAGNIGAIALVCWFLVVNCMGFINAIIYFDTSENLTPVWCDIVVKFQSAQQTGISAACLCINRRLAIIASSRRVDNGGSSKRLVFWADVSLVTVPPAFIMVVAYTVQANRYNVLQDYGCIVANWWELYAVLGLLVPPLLLGISSFVYGGVSIYNFVSQRRRFQSLMQQSSSSLNASRFFRLLAISAIDMLVSVPLGLVLLVQQVGVLRPTYSWADVHYGFSQVLSFNAEFVEKYTPGSMALQALSKWLPVFGAFFYFACFGMHDTVLDLYIQGYHSIARKFSSNKSAPPDPIIYPTLGTTNMSPSEGWSGRPDLKLNAEEDHPYAFEETGDGDMETSPWGRGVLVKVERNVV